MSGELKPRKRQRSITIYFPKMAKNSSSYSKSSTRFIPQRGLSTAKIAFHSLSLKAFARENYKLSIARNYNIQYEAIHLFCAHKSIRLIRRTQNIWKAEVQKAAEINNSILSPKCPRTYPGDTKLFEIFHEILFHREACRLLQSLPISYHVESICGNERPVHCSNRFPFLITLKAFAEMVMATTVKHLTINDVDKSPYPVATVHMLLVWVGFKCSGGILRGLDHLY
ncbi:hypothetical protein CEXT_788011 [Caerostris extrusa]|uniref:Uncharacterized protein n=1 Tax=Caerostris extrusa TaxID=172846 RepID=A0AAV4NQI1_CAEEX|nr:hypothetical protein CEXT_788011 [Caerostris extrusa]